MEGQLTMQQGQGNMGEILGDAAMPKDTEQRPLNDAQGRNLAVESQPNQETCASTEPCSQTMHAPVQTAATDATGMTGGQEGTSRGRNGSSAACDGIPPASDAKCGDKEGCDASPEMQGTWHQGGGAQQAGPIPGGQPHYAAYPYSPGSYGTSFGPWHYSPIHNPGPYGVPPYGVPLGGPQQWPHPGSPQWPHPGSPQGHHPGCHARHDGMHVYGPQGPPVDAGRFMGFGPTGGPLHASHGEENLGHVADIFGKAMQGQATPKDLVNGLLNLNFHDDQFWKGVVLGSVAALVLNSDAVRQALTGMLGGIFGKTED